MTIRVERVRGKVTVLVREQWASLNIVQSGA